MMLYGKLDKEFPQKIEEKIMQKSKNSCEFEVCVKDSVHCYLTF